MVYEIKNYNFNLIYTGLGNKLFIFNAFFKDVVNTVLVIVGTVFAVVTFFYTIFFYLIKKYY